MRMPSRAFTSVLSLVSVGIRSSIGIVALVLAVALARYLYATRPEPERKPHTTPGLLVRSLEVEPVRLPRLWRGYGTVRPIRSADIHAEVAGVIIEKPDEVEAGRAVEKGALLARIDPEEFQARVNAQAAVVEAIQARIERLEAEEANVRSQYEIVEQELELARARYDRAVAAFERSAGTRNEVEEHLAEVRRIERTAAGVRQILDLMPSRRAELRARLAEERASLRLAEIDLARTQIRAPFAASVQIVDVREGEHVQTGRRIVRIVDLSRVEVPLRLPASAGDQVRIGDPVEITTDAPDPWRWSGTVSGIAPEADAASRSITVLAEVRQDPADAGSLLRPGRFVVGRVSTGEALARFVVPRSAVVQDRVAVARTQDGVRVAEFVPARVAFHFDGRIESLDPIETQWAILDPGLSAVREGDTLIISNLDEVRSGSRVVVEGADAAVAREAERRPGVSRAGAEGGS